MLIPVAAQDQALPARHSLPSARAACAGSGPLPVSAAAMEPVSPFAELGLDFPEECGYQPLLEPLLQDTDRLGIAQSLPAAQLEPQEDQVAGLRVTAAGIGTSRFRCARDATGWIVRHAQKPACPRPTYDAMTRPSASLVLDQLRSAAQPPPASCRAGDCGNFGTGSRRSVSVSGALDAGQEAVHPHATVLLGSQGPDRAASTRLGDACRQRKLAVSSCCVQAESALVRLCLQLHCRQPSVHHASLNTHTHPASCACCR